MVSSSFSGPRAMAEVSRLMASVPTAASSENRLPASLRSKPSARSTILTTDFSAEYAGVANIRVSTKRGGSQYHGSAVYNNKNSALAAWTLDDLNGKANFVPTAFQSKYPTRISIPMTLAARLADRSPIFKKTWFFTSYERDYDVNTVSSNRAPSPTLRSTRETFPV